MTGGVLTRNAHEPRRMRCPDCEVEALRVYLAGGRSLIVDHPELDPEALEPGLYVAVNAFGDARPVRWPCALANGEALHRPHQLSCGVNA